MTEQELLKKYDILEEKTMRATRASIVNLIGQDDYTNDRGFLVNYADEQSDNDDDLYFYEMLNHIVFIKEKDAEGNDLTAYTTPDTLICLNYPNTEIVPMDNAKYRRWYFVYCHECMHQLWNTFKVADKIKAKGIEYNHMLLNIASDCVINDYLRDVSPSGKLPPVGGIFPEVLKDQFGVEFNRHKDTQFTLYNKLIALNKNKQNDLIDKFGEDFDGKKLTPKKINKQPAGPDGPPPPPPSKHSKDFIDGWTQAIKDVLDKKVDPTKYSPKQSDKDYDKGYNAAIDNIKKGLEDGLDLPEGGKGGDPGPKSDLPQIPWDLPKQQGGSSGNDKDSKDSKDSNGNQSQQQNQQQNKQQNQQQNQQSAVYTAKQAADAAQQAADKAKDIADKLSNSNASKENKDIAKDAAKAAQEAANKAKDAAKDAAKAAQSDDAKDLLDSTQKAISEATNAAAELAKAKEAAKDTDGSTGDSSDDSKGKSKGGDSSDDSKGKSKGGDSSDDSKGKSKGGDSSDDSNINDAIESAKKSLENIKSQLNDTTKSSSNKGSTDVGDLFDREILNELKSHGERMVSKYKDSPTGKLRKFVEQCQLSKDLKPSGLLMDAPKGNTHWDKDVELKCKNFVFQKIKAQKMYKRTYKRFKRGEAPFSQEDFGNRILTKGKLQIKEKMGFDINLFIDTSGSMSGCIDAVFKNAYKVVDSMIKSFAPLQEIDANKIKPRTFIFTQSMREIKYGETCRANGGTYAFETLIADIHKEGNNAMCNIVITDGDFNNINNNEVINNLSKMESLFILITNKPVGEFSSLEKAAKSKLQDRFAVLYADDNFTVK